ncbi:MAG: uridine monophosphate kinase, partial [Clostridia bacterium]|nr:uridine monophosphate kinase [Clostridia bacterium]
MGNGPAYKRVLLKLSGEALAKDTDEIFNHDYMAEVAGVIKKCCDAGVQVAIIVGAGNIWRGRSGGDMDRVRADNIGMLATCMNAIALQEALCGAGLDARVMSAVQMDKFAELYTADAARRHLDKGRVVIFACGLGSPFFSTDTPAVIRAMEINADALLLAKNIDYLYTADPRTDPSAEKIEQTTYSYIIDNRLHAIDMTASVLAESGHI